MAGISGIDNAFVRAQRLNTYAGKMVDSFELCLAIAAGVTDNPVEQKEIAKGLNSSPISVATLAKVKDLGAAEKEAVALNVEQLFPQDTAARLTPMGEHKYQELTDVLKLRDLSLFAPR